MLQLVKHIYPDDKYLLSGSKKEEVQLTDKVEDESALHRGIIHVAALVHLLHSSLF